MGAESLVRWTHPRHGDVPPSVLIPLVNALDLGLPLFRFVAARTIDMLLTLEQAGIQIPIAVNACARTLCTPALAELADQLAERMQSAGLPPQLLKVELTEEVQALCDVALSTSLAALQAKGFAVSLDDFGSGCATPQLVRSMPFDEMKIDAALVQGLPHSASSRKAVKDAVALARQFNLRVIAEGVEDEATASLLAAMGCQTGQGYFLSRPLESGAFLDTLRPLQ